MENKASYGLTAAQRSTEEIIQAKGLNAPRVTPADIDAAIREFHFINAGVAVHGTYDPHSSPLNLLTLCILVTTNGFTVVGKSACASPENFDEELGQKIALEDAKRQLWPLLGYALKERLAQNFSEA